MIGAAHQRSTFSQLLHLLGVIRTAIDERHKFQRRCETYYLIIVEPLRAAQQIEDRDPVLIILATIAQALHRSVEFAVERQLRIGATELLDPGILRQSQPPDIAR